LAVSNGSPPGALKNEISSAIVQLLHDYTGRGPAGARTYVADDLVTVVLRDTMTAGETNLVSAGHEAFVLELRHKFQMAMKDDSVEVIERLTGRNVVAFMSTNNIEPDIAAEIYMLEPETGEQAGRS
jgi:uncharacterized protein YbcI